MTDLQKYGYSDWSERLAVIAGKSQLEIMRAGQSFLSNAIWCVEDAYLDRSEQAATDMRCAQSIFALLTTNGKIQ